MVLDCTMIDWDDIRYFLAVARGGSVRAAAKSLGVNHATVLRRIAQLEERLGALMFEKLPAGYRLTVAGEEVLELAKQMEASSLKLETRVLGRDQSVRGLLRVTLAPPLVCSCRTSPISRVCIRTSRWKSCRPASSQI
jgi:molybdate transport repressor ModE-like protein